MQEGEEITHLRGRAGVEGVLWRAQGRSFSLESAAVLGLAQLPAKHNRGLVTPPARGTAGTAHLQLGSASNSAWRCHKGAPAASGALTGSGKEKVLQENISGKLEFLGSSLIFGALWKWREHHRAKAELLDT